MTLSQCIIQAPEPLGLPVVPDVGTLHRSRYLVLSYGLIPAQPAGNRPTWYRALIQVHLYLPLEDDRKEVRRQILRTLVDADMTWPETIDAIDEGTQHKVFEYETFVGKDDLQMAGKTRSETAGYYDVQNMKFAPKKFDAYGTALLDMKYVQSISPSALLEATEQYIDNRLVYHVPSDTGCEGEVGTTTSDPELEKTAGFVLEDVDGLITTSIANYLRDALCYEFLELDEDGKQSVVRYQTFSTGTGKGSATYITAKGSAELGTYSYPFRAYGDPLKDFEDTGDYKDKRGMSRTACLYTCRLDNTDYVVFGDAVPMPKVAAAPEP